MMFQNELLGILLYLVSFGMMMIGYKFLGKRFLFAWVVMAVIIANIQVVITVPFFGMVATLGNLVYGSIFLVTDILNEKYGGKEARRAVWLGFLTSVSVLIIMQITVRFIPHESDVMMQTVKDTFAFFPRIVGASLFAYLTSQLLDTYIYQKIKDWKPSRKYLFLRNNGSTLVSQFVDTTIFVSLAFAGVYPIEVIISIFISTYVLKFLVGLADTPFVYLATIIKPNSSD
jgi:queuosine precursor transporter